MGQGGFEAAKVMHRSGQRLRLRDHAGGSDGTGLIGAIVEWGESIAVFNGKEIWRTLYSNERYFLVVEVCCALRKAQMPTHLGGS